MAKQRFEKLAALLLIGDGLLTCMRPSREARAWKFSPEPLRTVVGAIAGRPKMTRLVGVVQVGIGVWWILRGSRAGGSPRRALHSLPAGTTSANSPQSA